MKLTAICALAAMGLALVSCGGHNAEEVKTIFKADKYTAEQESTGLGWYIEFQEEQIKQLKEDISDVEDNVLKAKAYMAGVRVYSKVKNDDNSEAYKKVKDQITKNDQEIEKLRDELKKAEDEAEKKLGFE